ncbi:hypothetical protein ACFPTO_17610 [Paraburkholderia denitrificans]|uniref:Uncharacterized protein n=1 Tax=Paraburkholderia denitrificans TaxID=694025 RepID=A0ABW0JBX8_9BURK
MEVVVAADVAAHARIESPGGEVGFRLAFPGQQRQHRRQRTRQLLRRFLHGTRLTLRHELGVEMAMQHAAQRVFEQAQPLVGEHEHLDLGAESPVLLQ